MTDVAIWEEVGQLLDAEESDLRPDQLPSLIEFQFDKIKSLEKKVQEAVDNAEKASREASEAQSLRAGRGIFKDYKREAIEGLQGAGMSLSKAVQSNSEAQRLSFEFQEVLAKISKILLLVGITNTANSRIVVRELELRMKGASEEEVSELARKELLSVVRQLKEQEDFHRKQERVLRKIESHDEKLRFVASEYHRFEAELRAQADIDNRHSQQLESQFEADKRHEAELRAQAEADRRHEAELKAQAEADRRHEAELLAQAETDRRYEAELKAQAEADKRHSEELKAQARLDALLDERITALERDMGGLKSKALAGYIAIVVGSLALVLSIVNFL